MKYQVAVRALTEFTAKQGDLDLRFTPSPSALEGMAGHAVIASRRGDHYETEIPLAGAHGALRVRGRADGYDPDANQLEEFKTYRGDLERMPQNHRHLHWAQVKIYGWLLCKERGLEQVKVALVYFDIVSQRETILVEEHSPQAVADALVRVLTDAPLQVRLRANAAEGAARFSLKQVTASYDQLFTRLAA